MSENEILYNHNSVLIALLLFIVIIALNEMGFRLGRFVQGRTDDEIKSLTGSIQGSILGLLALLLGFTFSMAMQRFDNRNMAIIDEANALGTALLRVKLLPVQHQNDARNKLADYLDLRIAMGKIDLTEHQERRVYFEKINHIQDALWEIAVTATHEDPRAVTSGAFVKSLNDLIDSQGKRTALQQMHVPEAVILLLFLVFASSGAILGYSAGLSGSRIVAPVALVSCLITLIVFIIIDLDRPKRGLIKVEQSLLEDIRIERT